MEVDVLNTLEASNIYLVIEGKDAILIDPGYNKNNCLINHIKKLDVNVKYILITHGHYDHIEALMDVLKLFPNAITYIHSLDEICLTSPKYNLSRERMRGEGEISFNIKNLVTLSDKEELNLLNHKIYVMHTPFHSKGSVLYIFKDEEIIFSGDTLFYGTIGRTDLITSEPRKMEDSLRKIKELNADYVIYPGHWNKTTLFRELKYNMYLRNL